MLELRSAQHPNEAKAFENREFTRFTATSKLVVTRDSNERDLSSFELDKARGYFLKDFSEGVNVSAGCRRVKYVTKQADGI